LHGKNDFAEIKVLKFNRILIWK